MLLIRSSINRSGAKIMYPFYGTVLSNNFSTSKSFYEILEVPRNATPKEIRISFLKKGKYVEN